MRIIACPEQEHWFQIEHLLHPLEVDLAIFPEPCCDDGAFRKPQASDDLLSRELSKVAEGRNCAILAPYVEQEARRHYSSALFIDQTGRGLCSYRKTHLGADDRRRGLTKGNWLSIVPFKDWKIGLMLGDDLLHPEPARCLALAGASLLVACSTLEPTLMQALARVRALENQRPTLVVGGGRQPRMTAADREGRLLIDAPTPAILDLPDALAILNEAEVRERRSELYSIIAQPIRPS